MRTKGAAIGTATNWIFNFMGYVISILCKSGIIDLEIVVEITPPGIQSLGWQFYII